MGHVAFGYLARHLLSVLALPTIVVVLVPIWIARRTRLQPALPAAVADALIASVGAILFAIGFALFAAALHHFFVHGAGTLAPWDPPRRFVTRGPYRYVRNPMIGGVIFMLFGTALVLRSRPHLQWAALPADQCDLHPAVGRAPARGAIRRRILAILPSRAQVHPAPARLGG